jgi:hypothetical protein
MANRSILGVVSAPSLDTAQIGPFDLTLKEMLG